MIFLDTNVMPETLKKAPDSAVIAWMVRHDAELALQTVAVAEIAFGIQKIRPYQRADRLEEGLVSWRRRFSDKIFAFTEEAALAYGDIMGERCAAGEGDVGSERHDRGDSADQWWPVGDPKPQRFRDNRARIDLALAILTGDPIYNNRAARPLLRVALL